MGPGSAQGVRWLWLRLGLALRKHPRVPWKLSPSSQPVTSSGILEWRCWTGREHDSSLVSLDSF